MKPADERGQLAVREIAGSGCQVEKGKEGSAWAGLLRFGPWGKKGAELGPFAGGKGREAGPRRREQGRGMAWVLGLSGQNLREGGVLLLLLLFFKFFSFKPFSNPFKICLKYF